MGNLDVFNAWFASFPIPLVAAASVVVLLVGVVNLPFRHPLRWVDGALILAPLAILTLPMISSAKFNQGGLEIVSIYGFSNDLNKKVGDLEVAIAEINTGLEQFSKNLPRAAIGGASPSTKQSVEVWRSLNAASKRADARIQDAANASKGIETQLEKLRTIAAKRAPPNNK
jgi:hypothetical protein